MCRVVEGVAFVFGESSSTPRDLAARSTTTGSGSQRLPGELQVFALRGNRFLWISDFSSNFIDWIVIIPVPPLLPHPGFHNDEQD